MCCSSTTFLDEHDLELEKDITGKALVLGTGSSGEVDLFSVLLMGDCVLLHA